MLSPPFSARLSASRGVLLLFLTLVCLARLSAAYTWSGVAIGGGGYVTGVVYHPAEQNLRYARTDVGGAWRWDQAGARWQALNDDIGGLNNEFMALGVLSLALDPGDPERVYLACGQYLDWWAPAARLLRSTDRGATWTQITLPFKLGGNSEGRGTGERLAVDPHNPARLLLGTNDAGLWRSTDRGSTWTRLTAFTPLATTFVLPDRSNPGVVYVGVPDNTGPTLWRTTDDGATWAAVPNQPLGLMALQGALDASGTLYLTYANAQGPNGATSGAVRKLANAATATAAAGWTTINPPSGQGGYCGLSLDARRPGVLVVSTLDRWWPRDEVYYSENGGASWKGMLDGATLTFSSGPWASASIPHWITDIEIDPFDSTRATFVTGFGLFTTTNLTVASGKPTWAFANAGLEETVPTGLVSPASGPPLVSTVGDVDGFRHDSLTAPPAARHSPRMGSNHSLDGAGNAPSVLVRLHGDGSVSRDGGSTWTVFPTTPPTSDNGEGRIAISADGARLLWCPIGSTPYWSANDGLTWTASTGAPDGSGGSLLPAADRVNALDFYVYDPASRRVLRSTDGGASFAPVSPQLPTGTNNLRAVPGFAGELWVSSDGNGLRRLTAGGATVAQLTLVQAAYGFGFGKAAPDATYPAAFIWGTVGGVTGLFRSDNAGAGWTRINDNAHQFGATTLITGDPRVYGRVYVGSSGRGILVGEIDSGAPPVLQPSLPVYEDALGAGWNNWSWATVNLAATSPARRGTNAIAVTAGSYQAAYFNCATLDATGFTAIAFWIHGGSSGGQSLQLSALRSAGAQAAVNLAAPVAGAWTRVVVPLSDLGVAGVPDFTGFWIQNRTGSTLPVFYLDDLTLVGEADAPAWNAPATATVTLGGLSAIYDGAAKAATASTSPAGLAVTLTYDGGPSAPSAVGSYAVVATVNTASNQGSATGTLVIRTSLAAFRAQYFTAAELADSATSGPLADPDQDGLPNLLEYALALDPKAPETAMTPVASLSEGRLTLTFIRRRDVADLAYAVQVSDDLQTWVSGSGVTEEIAVEPLDAVRERVTARDLTGLGASRRFLRLQVSLSP